MSLYPTVTLGRWPQEDSEQPGVTPVSWLVLETRGERSLLLSERVLSSHRFHAASAVIWRDSEIRQYLRYLEAAMLSSEERARIAVTEVITSDGRHDDDAIPLGGQPIVTEDRLFLLSLAEVERYFPTDAARLAAPTRYAETKGCYRNPLSGGSGWWLRDRGFSVAYASDVLSDGALCPSGEEVWEEGGVRPAMWVKR